MDKLLHTSLYRAILKSLNQRKIPEHMLQIYLSEFVQQVTAICDKQNCLSALRILNYTQIQFQYLSCRITALSISRPQYISQFIDLALDVLRMEKELLYYRIEHPQPFISEPAFTSPLHWSKKYHAVDLSEILCSFDLMSPRPIILSDGREAPFYLVIQHFEQFLNVKLGNPGDIKRRVLERKKDRTKFTEIIFHTLNDDENE